MVKTITILPIINEQISNKPVYGEFLHHNTLLYLHWERILCHTVIFQE